MAALRSKREQAIFRSYIADTLMAVVNNTAKFAGGSTIKNRFAELIEVKEAKPERSADEVIVSITEKLAAL